MIRAKRMRKSLGRKWIALGVTVAALGIVAVAAGTATGWHYMPHHNNYYPFFYYPPTSYNSDNQNVNVNTLVDNNALVDIDNHGSYGSGGYGWPYNCGQCGDPSYGSYNYQPVGVDINQGAAVDVAVVDYGGYSYPYYPYYGYPSYGGYNSDNQNVNVNTMVSNNALVSVDNHQNYDTGDCGCNYPYYNYGSGSYSNYNPVDVDINQGAMVNVDVIKDAPYGN